jgi:tetratricopeptide (TPR) repeat protein
MQRNIVTVIQTLAHELASMHPKTVPDIASATRLGGSSHEVLSAYLKRYLLAPIQALKLPRSMVIVLDALDECDNHQLLLKALAEIAEFSGIKIFITSRPEVSIENAIDSSLVEKVVLKRVSQAKMEDYFCVRFGKMSWAGRQPTPGDISEMAKLADGLLIWAATSCNFIENDMQDDESYQLLQNILSAGKARDIASDDQLASLYHTTLTHLFWPKHAHIFYLVFQAMLVVQVPMTVEVFAKTFDLGIRQTRAVHSALFALQIYETLDKDVILPAAQRFHSSFLDYITNDQLRSPPNQFYIDPSLAHATIAQKCLSRIPDIASCFQNGQARSCGNLEQDVKYATGYWPFHLTQSVLIQGLLPNQANEALNRLAHDGMPTWTPFYLVVSQSLSQALEGPGSRNAVDAAISFHNHSLQLFTATGIDQTGASSDFGFALWKRYEQSGFNKDLEDSISLHSEFLHSHPSQSLQRAQALFRLGKALLARFNTPLSSKDDLDNTISTLTEALNLYSAHDVQHYQSLSVLGSTLRIRFEETGRAKDLDDAISLQTRAMEMARTTNPFDHTRACNNVATCLISRFEETNDVQDLDKAISILYSILQDRPPGHPYRPSTLNNIAFSLQRRYEQSGILEDLNNAIAMHYDVLESRPAPHQFRAQTLVNLALCLRYRFEITGTMTDIDEAIANDSEAFKLRPSAHPYHLFSLTRLGIDFHTRFLHTGNDDDLSKAISNLRKVIELCPESHRELFDFLSTLGNALRTRFEEKGDQQDLADALDMQRRSQKLCPPRSLELPNILHNLGATLLTQYEQNQSQETLAEAIGTHRAALKLRPGSNPRRFESLNNLARALHHQYRESKKQEALDEALALYTEALGLCGTTHPSRSIAVEGLADVLYSRFELCNSFDDLDRSIAMYEERLTLTSSLKSGRKEKVLNDLAIARAARRNLNVIETARVQKQ